MSITGINYQNEPLVLPKGNVWLVAIGLSFLLYGISSVLNYVILLIFVVGMFFLIRHRLLDLLLIPLFFFDNVLLLPFASGTFIRIFEIVYVLYFLWAGKGIIIVRDRAKFAMAFIYFLMSIWYSFSLSEAISAFLNVFVVYLIYNNRFLGLSTDDEYTLNYNKNLILYSFVLASTLAAIYAFLRGNRVYGFRLAGTVSDPNYTALLYIYGFFAIMGCGFLTKRKKLFLEVISLIALLATVSFSGILCFSILLMLYLYVIKPQKGFLIAAAAIGLFFIVINVPSSGNTFISGIQYRIERSMNALWAGDYNTLTSHRFELFGIYLNKFLNETSFHRQLIGGTDPTIRGFIDTSHLYQSYVVSHNSYLDMLFMVGIIGTLFVVLRMIMTAKSHLKKYTQSGDIEELSIAFIKITTMVMAFSLSLFPYKLFTIGFLL